MCMDINQKTTKIANSGRPTPVRIAVAVSQSMTSLPGTPAGEDSEPTNVTVPAASSPSKKPPVGAIVGGLIGGFSVVLGLLFALWRCRRRRTNFAAEAETIAPRPYTTMYPEPNSATLLHPAATPSMMEYASVPASDWSRPSKEWQHTHDVSASRSPTEALSHSDGAFSRSDVGLYHSDGASLSPVTDRETLPPPPRYSRI
ncbi:hypothetical protein R3P38DRAFT_618707 [Favolaschia claudopus]|uniref:Uncharacterized protein n=1 Tax=Favolaschia claudopus TaxID=2862362 RepID=A0AAW0CCQ1_9AGAR